MGIVVDFDVFLLWVLIETGLEASFGLVRLAVDVRL